MIDTHAHIQDERYENLEEVIMGAKALGVNKIVCASSDIQTSKKAINIAEKYENVYATVPIPVPISKITSFSSMFPKLIIWSLLFLSIK